MLGSFSVLRRHRFYSHVDHRKCFVNRCTLSCFQAGTRSDSNHNKARPIHPGSQDGYRIFSLEEDRIWNPGSESLLADIRDSFPRPTCHCIQELHHISMPLVCMSHDRICIGTGLLHRTVVRHKSFHHQPGSVVQDSHTFCPFRPAEECNDVSSHHYSTVK